MAYINCLVTNILQNIFLFNRRSCWLIMTGFKLLGKLPLLALKKIKTIIYIVHLYFLTPQYTVSRRQSLHGTSKAFLPRFCSFHSPLEVYPSTKTLASENPRKCDKCPVMAQYFKCNKSTRMRSTNTIFSCRPINVFMCFGAIYYLGQEFPENFLAGQTQTIYLKYPLTF